MLEVRQLSCCGVKEIHYLSEIYDSKKDVMRNLRCLAEQIFHGGVNGCFFLFSQATRSSLKDSTTSNEEEYGEVFKNFIISYNLGKVYDIPPEINPNSRNLLKIWIWVLDHARLSALTGVGKPDGGLPVKNCRCGICTCRRSQAIRAGAVVIEYPQKLVV